MAPTYTPVSTDEEAVTQNRQKRAPTWLKALWIMQGLFSFMNILGVPLIITFLFMQASSLVLVIGLMVQAFDTWASAWIIVQVRQQLSAPRTKATLRKEGYKAAIGTWWMVRIPFDSSAKLIKPAGYEQYDQQQKAMFEEIMSKIWIVKVFLVIFLVVAFYIPLWAAWKDRKADEQGGKGGEVELEDQQIGLLRAQSSDGPDDFVEQDTVDDKRKARG